ncbi:hypothetical protein [Pelolinea submarina]|uniref:Uncharacterized protein n=1 Tax=Pelolinea submarina TaxID=913107 RepID=A0A3E0AMQ5_9CHLR|nr:hypothetical protein [Pelolinea submarina]REG11190.1 hypothetical protein DFR64_1067 [Pelolinea submarina]
MFLNHRNSSRAVRLNLTQSCCGVFEYRFLVCNQPKRVGRLGEKETLSLGYGTVLRIPGGFSPGKGIGIAGEPQRQYGCDQQSEDVEARQEYGLLSLSKHNIIVRGKVERSILPGQQSAITFEILRDYNTGIL